MTNLLLMMSIVMKLRFTTPNDEIIKFISPIGDTDVPYPMAYGENYVYSFIEDISYISNKDFLKGINKNITPWQNDPSVKYFELEPFFISTSNKSKPKPKISLENFRGIMNKPTKDISLKELKIIAEMYSVTTSGNKKQIIDRIEQLRFLKFNKG